MSSFRKVHITAKQVLEFGRMWPCNGFPEDTAVTAEFAPNGDLIDIQWENGQDYWECELSGALLAIINHFGEKPWGDKV